MDYGFVTGFAQHPESRKQLARLRQMFTRRKDTKLINKGKARASVRNFLTFLNTSGSKDDGNKPIVLPVGDLLLGGHATEEGKVFIPLFRKQRGPTVFETIADTMTDTDKSINIPSGLVGGTPKTHAVHLKGCNLGKAPKFLKKLRAAFGTQNPQAGNVQLSAPKHFHGLTNGFSGGTIEFMAYEFAVAFPQPLINDKLTFPSQAEVVDKFKAANLSFFDRDDPVEGKTPFPVPPSFWDTWIPSNVRKTTSPKFTAHLGETVAGNRTVEIFWQFRVDKEPFNQPSFPAGFPMEKDFDPNKEPGKTKALGVLKAVLVADTHFQKKSEDDFPYYERVGFKDIDAFLGGYTWLFQIVGTNLRAVGHRILYTAVIPITDPNTNPNPRTGTLFFNFYPSGVDEAITHMPVTDPRFFLVLADE